MYAIYTRSHSAHAWRYERQTPYLEVATLEIGINKQNFDVDTLVVPVAGLPLPVWLDSYQTQADFPILFME
jgi:hypothetical protein